MEKIDEIEKRETLADIVAEIRAYGAQPPPRLMWLDIADRIEAAWKRECAAFDCECAGIAELAAKEEAARHTPGNTAALREAVVALLDAMDSLGCDESTAALAALVPDMADSSARCLAGFRKAKAAISAPARQCDVGTAEEQEARYKMTGEVYHTLTLTNALAWAQTPYAEEGAGE